MKVSNLIFSAPMVCALLARTKRQTRRIVRVQPPPEVTHAGYFFRSANHPTPAPGVVWLTGPEDLDLCDFHGDEFPCPWGGPGDLIYVREACRATELREAEAARLDLPVGLDGVVYLADQSFVPIAPTAAAADLWGELYHYGVKRGHSQRRGRAVPAIHQPRWASRITLELSTFHVERLSEIDTTDALAEGVAGVAEYFDLWRALHGEASLKADPWVWVLQFDVHAVQVDELLRQRGIEPPAEEQP